MDRRTFLAQMSGAAAGSAIVGWSHAFAQGSTQPARSPIVEISSGHVQLPVEAGVNVFKGIPYGAPTGGANRFRAPPAGSIRGRASGTRWPMARPRRKGPHSRPQAPRIAWS